MTLRGLIELSEKTLLMVAIFCNSEYPTMESGERSLMKGNCVACAMVAARAVFPDPGGPEWRKISKGQENSSLAPTVQKNRN